MEKYTWHILRLSEDRWENSEDVYIEEGHVFYYNWLLLLRINVITLGTSP